MAKTPKRTASFKYCSKRKEKGCRRAKKTCSFRKDRSPKCQPKKSAKKSKPKKKATGSKKKATGSKKKGSKKNTRTPASARKKIKGIKLSMSPQQKGCSKKKSKKSCASTKNGGKTDESYQCAWDPKKNPACSSGVISVFDLFLRFENKAAKLKFTYPVTKDGAQNCLYVVKTKVNNGKQEHFLYLRYSKAALLPTMKEKYAKALKLWFCTYGEVQAAKYVKGGETAALAHRIGQPLKINERQLQELMKEGLSVCTDLAPDPYKFPVPAAAAAPGAGLNAIFPPRRVETLEEQQNPQQQNPLSELYNPLPPKNRTAAQVAGAQAAGVQLPASGARPLPAAARRSSGRARQPEGFYKTRAESNVEDYVRIM